MPPQALNFQLVLIIAYIVFGLLSPRPHRHPAPHRHGDRRRVVFQIIAAIKANNGEWYRYPMTPDWVK